MVYGWFMAFLFVTLISTVMAFFSDMAVLLGTDALFWIHCGTEAKL